MPGKRLKASAHRSPGRRSGPRAATELFHALVEHSSEAVALLDETGAISYVSPAATRLLGYTVAELTGTTAFGFLHPDDLSRMQQLCRRLLDEPGLSITTELRARHKDGSYRLVAAVAVNRLDEPAVGAVVANWRDITERLRAEEALKSYQGTEAALRNSEESYRSLVEGVRDVIFALSPGGEVTSLNPAFEEMTGFPPGEWVGRPFEALVHPEDVPLALELFGRVLRGAPRPTIQFRILTKTGPYRVAEFSASAQLRDGKLLGILGIGRDVTDRLGLEQQLRQAQKMEAVGRLAGGVAHDFNNILTAITGHAELLLEDLGHHDPRRADVDEIRRSAERAAGLTRQLLAFSRQQVLQPKVVDLNALVLDMDKLLRRLIGEDVELATVLDPTLGRVTADPGQLEQVIVNLAVNARDAMPQGGKLTLETKNVDLDADYPTDRVTIPAGRYVMLAVTDTGTGMDAQTKARIFEPFFTTKAVGKGTGLGLATVYGAVQQSGGHIWLYSEVGQGTSFKIYLPRVDAVHAPAPVAEAAVVLDGSETVLVAEDEDAVRQIIEKALQARGYKVMVARDGSEALALASRHAGQIDLLVSDVIMPDMNGRVLSQRLTQGRPTIKTLYLSGYTDDAILHHGVLEEGVAFLQKPFSLGALARKVREVIEARP